GMQSPSQSAWPGSHSPPPPSSPSQTPSTQTPDGHTLPHSPQLSGSASTGMQSPSQSARPGSHSSSRNDAVWDVVCASVPSIAPSLPQAISENPMIQLSHRCMLSTFQ